MIYILNMINNIFNYFNHSYQSCIYNNFNINL